MATTPKREPGDIVHKDKDLRIPNAAPWRVAQAAMRGKVPRKPKSRRSK